MLSSNWLTAATLLFGITSLPFAGCGSKPQSNPAPAQAQDPVIIDIRDVASKLVSIALVAGDEAEYEIQETSADGTVTVSRQRMRVIAVDSSANEAEIETTNTDQDGTETVEKQKWEILPGSTPRSDLKGTIEKCRRIGLYRSVSVPAGSFDACFMDSGEPTEQHPARMKSWTADVPFGVVRKEMAAADGSSHVLVLKSFVAGK
ncbi:MAG: hypothetical protein A2428_17635 [Bdellovibrionales bacterium RIFOXYC1_FULL_54_43]|nr:MAG: hypothetical protein A2428_17635 [Bdellovibrionales bacterium RIFOXYC1_FULL_54_43]OFZ79508.1 MAG: hypothetical protein A2603_09875 [Bdellovibrionales bacterium RIFOXYD1_FULL_55_31]